MPKASTRHDRHALLIGIDAYPHFSPQAQLEGAVADATCFRSLLIDRLGFDPANVELLTNAEATRAGIIAALGRLLDRVAEGDAVWFHFSGHGSRRKVPRVRHRGDARQHVIVPYDSAHRGTAPNRDISGDELYAWLRHLSTKTARVTLVFDCCHAGTMTREERPTFGDAVGRLRTVEEDERATEAVTFPWTSCDRALPRRGASGWLAASDGFTLLAACRADQKAREITVHQSGHAARTHGALSHALIEAVLDHPATPTYHELHARIEASVRARYPRQHPQLEGAADRVVLTTDVRRAAPQLQVVARHGARLVLGGGEIHGVERGSVWGIVPGGAPADAAPVARAQVSVVSGVHSDAILLDAPERSVAVGSRAHRLQAGTAMPVLNVALAVPEAHRAWAAELAAAIDEKPTLRLVADPQRADVTVAVVGPRDRQERATHARMLGALETAVAVVVDRDDRIVLPIRRQLDGLARAQTASALEALAAHRRLRGLASPTASRLRDQVTMKIWKRDPHDHAWSQATPPRTGAAIRFAHDESFALTLTNEGDVAVHAHVVVLGVGGGIAVVYPQAGACEQLAPGATVWIGDRPGQEIWFEVPPTVPFEKPGDRPWHGDEIFLLVVTEDPTDLRPLFQDSYRNPSWQQTAVAHDFAALLGEIMSHGHREVGRGRSPRTVAWSVEQMIIDLRRP